MVRKFRALSRTNNQRKINKRNRRTIDICALYTKPIIPIVKKEPSKKRTLSEIIKKAEENGQLKLISEILEISLLPHQIDWLYKKRNEIKKMCRKKVI